MTDQQPAGSGDDRTRRLTPPPGLLPRSASALSEDPTTRSHLPPSVSPLRRGPRRARLAVKRVDPWSVLKFTFIYSLALLVVILVAVLAIYLVLDAMGVFTAVDTFVRDISGPNSSVGSYFTLRKAMGAAALVGSINVVLFTALATLGAFIYNLCADLVGGIEVTLTERD